MLRPWSRVAYCLLGLICWGLSGDSGYCQKPPVTDKPGMLLLEGNRVILGRVTPQGDTYSVEQAAGTLIVAKQQVVFVGADLKAAYHHLQESLTESSSSDEHVELARWCVGYRLLPEARFELQAALEVDPSRDDIRRNLNQLDALASRPVPTESKPVKSETPAQRMARLSGITANEVESLAGLPRDVGQEFTRRIQPILMHNCTASACHASNSDQKLKLSLVRQGSTMLRSTTEKNLLALLPYIDRDDARAGELWKLLKTNHGASGSSIFQGTRGKEQLKSFQDWLLSLEESTGTDSENDRPKIARVAAKSSPVAESSPRYRKGEHTRTVNPVSHEEPARIPEVASTKPRTTSKSKPPTSAEKLPDDESFVASVGTPHPVTQLVADDPFNPEEFNRQQRLKGVEGGN